MHAPVLLILTSMLENSEGAVFTAVYQVAPLTLNSLTYYNEKYNKKVYLGLKTLSATRV